MFFISVDFEGFRCVVSCLESTLVGWLVSIAFKWVRQDMIRASSGMSRCLARMPGAPKRKAPVKQGRSTERQDCIG
jgi:hypothetical protein